MKKILLVFAAFSLLSSCSVSDLTQGLSVSVALPSIEISTPSVQSGTFPLTKEVSMSTIDSLRGSANVSLTALTFSVISPDTLTLRGFTYAKLVVSANGQSVTVFDAPISQNGRIFTATTSADITPLLSAARSINSKLTFAMSVTTNAATPQATWRISTVATIQ
jgi:hypothetical protein